MPGKCGWNRKAPGCSSATPSPAGTSAIDRRVSIPAVDGEPTGADGSKGPAHEAETQSSDSPAVPDRSIESLLRAGDLREAAAVARDRAARLRDEAAADRERTAAERRAAGDMSGDEDDRAAAAADRHAAAVDRDWAGSDRDEAAGDRADLVERARHRDDE